MTEEEARERQLEELRKSIQESIRQMEAGEGIPVQEVKARIKARRNKKNV